MFTLWCSIVFYVFDLLHAVSREEGGLEFKLYTIELLEKGVPVEQSLS